VRAWEELATPSFRDLVIDRMSERGVYVEVRPWYVYPTYAEPLFEQVEIKRCGTGVEVLTIAGAQASSHVLVRMVDSSILGCTGDGVSVLASDATGTARLELERCRLLDNGGDGVVLFTDGTTARADLVATSSLFAGNHGCGVRGETAQLLQAGAAELRGCTVAGNGLAGLRTRVDYGAILTGSILAANPDDLDLGTPPTATYCLSGDGELDGYPGCLSGDAGFRDPPAADWRLRFDSACVDGGDPASVGELDLLGRPRNCDGVLDTVEAPDMGAFELQTLELSGSFRIGEPVRFELWGAAGAGARLFMTRAPLLDPQPTPYGALRLAREEATVIAALPLGDDAAVFERTLPDVPELVGSSFSFQALTTSAAAPTGAALSNAVQLVVQP
jgi:hypothetical protein